MKQSFTEYLTKHYRYRQGSLREKLKQIDHWKFYCSLHQRLETLDQSEILKITELLKNRYAISTVNSHLHTLEQYYNYLIEQQIRTDHPVKEFRIIADKPKLITHYLSEDQLNDLYHDYSSKGHYGGQFDQYRQRNKVVLGLMIYQGLGSGSIEQIRVQDIDINRATLHVPATTQYRLNSRILPLEAVQIMELNTYLQHTRGQLIQLMQTDTDRLIPSGCKTKFSSITSAIRRQIGIERLQTLRDSRIAIWLKYYNLREVQYRAGYKSLLSLEKYRTEKLESLRQAIEKYHPLG